MQDFSKAVVSYFITLWFIIISTSSVETLQRLLLYVMRYIFIILSYDSLEAHTAHTVYKETGI